MDPVDFRWSIELVEDFLESLDFFVRAHGICHPSLSLDIFGHFGYCLGPLFFSRPAGDLLAPAFCLEGSICGALPGRLRLLGSG
jgi:hypothetical protein